MIQTARARSSVQADPAQRVFKGPGGFMCDSPFYFIKAAQLRVGGFRGERGFESLRASLLRNQYFSSLSVLGEFVGLPMM